MGLVGFLKRTDGSATVEFTLWLPLLALILMFASDTSMLMHRQTLLYDAARDAARQVVTGTTDIATAESLLAARLHHSSSEESPYVARVSRADNFITAEISVPFEEVTLFSHVFFGRSTPLTGTVVMWDAATAITEATEAAEAAEEDSTS